MITVKLCLLRHQGATQAAHRERRKRANSPDQNRGSEEMLGTFLTQLAGQLSTVLDSIGKLVSGLL